MRRPPQWTATLVTLLLTCAAACPFSKAKASGAQVRSGGGRARGPGSPRRAPLGVLLAPVLRRDSYLPFRLQSPACSLTLLGSLPTRFTALQQPHTQPSAVLLKSPLPMPRCLSAGGRPGGARPRSAAGAMRAVPALVAAASPATPSQPAHHRCIVPAARTRLLTPHRPLAAPAAAGAAGDLHARGGGRVHHL